MNGAAIAAVIIRELRTIERELNAYPGEDLVWTLPPGLPNSAGTLALHAAGNLRHFIGTVLGGGSFVRDRDAEFSRRGVPRAELIEGLREAEKVVRDTLPSIDARSEEHTSELQSRLHLVCRLLLEKKKKENN